MVMLVNLEEAKAQVRITHDLEDDDIVLKIQAASAVIIRHLKNRVDFIDSSGEPDFALVPDEVRQATLGLFEIFFRRDPAAAEWQHGYLPPHIERLLYQLRDPAIA